MSIIPQQSSKLTSLAHFSAEDLKTEISKLTAQAAAQRAELLALEKVHRARPYRNEYVARLRHGYQSSLRELHNQISNVRSMLDQSGTVSVQI